MVVMGSQARTLAPISLFDLRALSSRHPPTPLNWVLGSTHTLFIPCAERAPGLLRHSVVGQVPSHGEQPSLVSTAYEDYLPQGWMSGPQGLWGNLVLRGPRSTASRRGSSLGLVRRPAALSCAHQRSELGIHESRSLSGHWFKALYFSSLCALVTPSVIQSVPGAAVQIDRVLLSIGKPRSSGTKSRALPRHRL